MQAKRRSGKKADPSAGGPLAPHMQDWLHRGLQSQHARQGVLCMLDVGQAGEDIKPKTMYYFSVQGPKVENLNLSTRSADGSFDILYGCGDDFLAAPEAQVFSEGSFSYQDKVEHFLPKELAGVVTELADVASELSSSEGQSLLRLARESDPGRGSAAPPAVQFEEEVFRGTTEVLGGVAELGLDVRGENDLLAAVSRGFPVGVLARLRDAGYPSEVLERTIAPRRTLARRRATVKRLTEAESDAAWRLAHCLVLADEVLRDRNASLEWLARPKPELADARPFDLLATGVGSRAVERLLLQLEWGNVA